MPDDISTLSVQSFPALVERRALRDLWIDDHGSQTWLEFGAAVRAAQAACATEGVTSGEIVVTPGEATAEALAWLLGAAGAGAIVAPLRRERVPELDRWKRSVRIGWQVVDGRLLRVDEGTVMPVAARLLDELRGRGQPGLILATGGTTGTPKLVLHDLAALLATVPVKQGAARRVMPLMRFDHIGGLDMAWRALGSGHLIVTPPAELTPDAVATAIERHAVEVLPATPSFLNLLVTAEAYRTHTLSSLRVVPYGAEPMPVNLLARLRAALPKVEFVQRFGTSETGALPVSDAGAGLLLGNDSAGFTWKIVDEELWVRSPARALGYLAGGGSGFDADGWFRTGDLAERLLDGSVNVLGRREELINVGGEKVLPAEVESVLLDHPLVVDCRVRAEPSPLLGQVVGVEVVWRGPETDAVVVKRALHAFAGELLPRHMLPVIVRLVSAVDTTGNWKKNRANPES